MRSGDRAIFGSKTAYIMALAGSAIGLGNIWRFPYVMGEHGGAAFLIVYLICAVLISLPIMLCESIIGRRGRSGTYKAMSTLSPGTKWKLMGFVSVICSFVIASYYSVVGGWSVDYFARSVIKGFNVSTPGQAGELSSKVFTSIWEPLFFHTVFIGFSSLVVMAGIKKGIEKFSKVTIPALFIMMVLIMFYSLSLPGSSRGVEYIIKPDFSKIDASCVAAAMGQSFYSMSLGIGCVLTYSSFTHQKDNLLSSSFWTMVFDSLFAVLAAFAIMPAVFAVGIKPEAGSTLVFETLPYIFSRMGEVSPYLSRSVSIIFFLTIIMAALTSEISMLEVCTEHLVEKRSYNRRKASVVVFIGAWSLGALCSLSFGVLSGVVILDRNIFGLCDLLSSNLFMTLGSLAFALFIGWVLDRNVVRSEFTNNGTLPVNVKIFDVFHFLVKWIAPVMIMVIFLTNLIF